MPIKAIANWPYAEWRSSLRRQIFIAFVAEIYLLLSIKAIANWPHAEWVDGRGLERYDSSFLKFRQGAKDGIQRVVYA